MAADSIPTIEKDQVRKITQTLCSRVTESRSTTVEARREAEHVKRSYDRRRDQSAQNVDELLVCFSSDPVNRDCHSDYSAHGTSQETGTEL